VWTFTNIVVWDSRFPSRVKPFPSRQPKWPPLRVDWADTTSDWNSNDDYIPFDCPSNISSGWRFWTKDQVIF